MWFMVVTVLALVWDWLPQITILLKFCTALVGFVIVAPLLVSRVRRWWHRRR
jgi:hypothetical protein